MATYALTNGDKTYTLLMQSKKPVKLQELTVTENGTFEPDEDYDGFSKVDVNIASEVSNIFFGTQMASEVLSEVLESKLTVLTSADNGILGTVNNYSTLNNLQYSPTTIEEYYQDILTSDNAYAEKVLTQVLE